jgi:hypothetical protein
MARQRDKGRKLATDPTAESAEQGVPAFVARPAGAPVYHGFVVLDDVQVEGFVLGTISDFESEPSDYGDGFVVGPDGRRAGLVWEIGPTRVEPITPPDGSRWGVWAVWFPHPMQDRESARMNLAEIVPLLRPYWEATRDQPAGEI